MTTIISMYGCAGHPNMYGGKPLDKALLGLVSSLFIEPEVQIKGINGSVKFVESSQKRELVQEDFTFVVDYKNTLNGYPIETIAEILKGFCEKVEIYHT